MEIVMRKMLLGLVVMAFLMAPGCFHGALSPAAKKQLMEAAKTADARSKSFARWSPNVKAKNADDEEALQRIIKAHGEGLASQAKALDELDKSVNTK